MSRIKRSEAGFAEKLWAFAQAVLMVNPMGEPRPYRKIAVVKVGCIMGKGTPYKRMANPSKRKDFRHGLLRKSL